MRKEKLRKRVAMSLACMAVLFLNMPAVANADTMYTVKKGDCLWSIAREFYGDGTLYTKIFHANSLIKNADLIYPGQVFVIPDTEATTEPITEPEGESAVVAELDTYVHSKNTTTNYSSDVNIIIGKEREAILKFDLTKISKDAEQIILRTYSYWGGGNEYTFSIIPEYDKVVDGITYDTMPAVGEKVGSFMINGSTKPGAKDDITLAAETEIDVTEVIKAYRTANPEATKIVFHIANSSASSCTEIRSTEHADGKDYAPTLCTRTKSAEESKAEDTPKEESAEEVTPAPTQVPEASSEYVLEITAELDTYVHSKTTDKNSCSDVNIIIGKEREAILKFDLTKISKDAEPIILRMYSYWGGGNEYTFSIIPEYDKVVDGITYDTMPAVGEKVGSFRINGSTKPGAKDDITLAAKTEIDVTEIIKAYRTANPEATKIVFHIANSGVSSCTEIRSTEHADGTSYAATLCVK